jgi:sec-independent protein translocase protein TatA
MSFQPFTIIVILVLGVLFFGKNLPGVAKQIGTSLVEFRKGLNEWKETHGRSAGVRESKPMATKEEKESEKESESEERFESFGTKFEPPS